MMAAIVHVVEILAGEPCDPCIAARMLLEQGISPDEILEIRRNGKLVRCGFIGSIAENESYHVGPLADVFRGRYADG